MQKDFIFQEKGQVLIDEKTFREWALVLLRQLQIEEKLHPEIVENSPLALLFSKDDGVDLPYLIGEIEDETIEGKRYLEVLEDMVKLEMIRRRIG